MKIQKGLVKYKDRSDIECLYGIMDDGTQYYFLDNTGKTLSNGNIIASTELVEAIDPMFESSKIGLINGKGSIVIPFENKSIKSVNDGILLVEKAQPTSQSVIDACNLRNDPLSATKLVSTPAAIKANLNTVMGGEGRYIFNDQFSEATICDINGNNLVNGELYSFIAMANDKLYFSKNTADSPIMEYALLTNSTVDVATAEKEESIDVGNVSVDPQQIDQAMASQENIANVPTDNVDTSLNNSELPVNNTENSTDNMDNSIVDSETPVDNTENNTIEEENSTISIPAGLSDNGAISENVSDTSEIEEQGTFNTETENADSDLVDENNTDGVVDSQDDIMAMTSDNNNSIVAEQQVENTSAEQQVENASAEENNVDVQTDINKESNDVETENPTNENVEETTDSADEKEQEQVEETEVNNNKEEIEDTSVEDKKGDVEPEIDESADKPLDLNFGDNTEKVDADTLVDEVVGAKEGDEDSDTSEISSDEISSEEKNDVEQNFDSIFDTDMNNDIFKDSVVSADSIADVSDDYMNSYEINSSSSDIANDIITSMNQLIRQNKTQKAEILSFESKKRQLSDKYREQTEKLKKLSDVADKLHSRNQLLESKVHEQIRVISSMDREIKELKAQLKSFKDLEKLSTVARELLDSNYSSYDYDDDSSYYRMSA